VHTSSHETSASPRAGAGSAAACQCAGRVAALLDPRACSLSTELPGGHPSFEVTL
jgi:hypothetical protein